MLRLPLARRPKAILPEAGQPGALPFRSSPQRDRERGREGERERGREMESRNPSSAAKKSCTTLKCAVVEAEQSASAAHTAMASYCAKSFCTLMPIFCSARMVICIVWIAAPTRCSRFASSAPLPWGRQLSGICTSRTGGTARWRQAWRGARSLQRITGLATTAHPSRPRVAMTISREEELQVVPVARGGERS